ncbi:unnamed protein product [Ixodes hexagonus]
MRDPRKMSWSQLKGWAMCLRKGLAFLSFLYKGCGYLLGPRLDCSWVPGVDEGDEWAEASLTSRRPLSFPSARRLQSELLRNRFLLLPPSLLHVSAQVVLLIVSPEFLDALDRRGAELFALGRLLEADRGLAMLCGVETQELGPALRTAFPAFGSWPLLEARNQDRDFVLSVVETTRSMLDRVEEAQRRAATRTASAAQPQFRLCPRKVHQGNNKVFVMLNHPVQQDQNVHLLLENSGLKEVQVKWKNPYVLQFVVPDCFLQVSKVINVHLRCDAALLGVRQLKCESQLSQLHALLQTVSSPYEMLCLTMGLATLHEVDVALAQNFRRNLPGQGFHLLGPLHQAAERKRSEEFLPTLLHFSAHYGLEELCSALLQCPGALSCCHMLNCKGHCPAHLASSAGHHRLATVISDFQASGPADVPLEEQTQVTVTPAARTHEVRTKHSPPHMHYENVTPCQYTSPGGSRPVPICNPSYGMTLVPAEPPEAVVEEQEAEYLSMLPFVEPPRTVPDPPHGAAGDDGPSIPAAESTADTSAEKPSPSGSGVVFSNTQEDLVKIIEMYKKGVPFGQIEKLFDDWRKNNETAKAGEESDLQALRELYKQKQRTSPASKQLFSFSDLRQILTGKGTKRFNRNRDLQKSQQSLLDAKDEASEGFRRVSTLSAASTSSSTSSSSSDRLSTMSSVSAYDSGTHSDSCEESRPVPPPRPPKIPTARQRTALPESSPHQYYAFPTTASDEALGRPSTSPRTGDFVEGKAGEDVLASDADGLQNSSDKTSKSALKADSSKGPSAGIYYDIPQAPRPVVQKPDPLLDYDFPMAALRRMNQAASTQRRCSGPDPDNGKHYYDVPRWTCAGPKEVRLSIPDVPAPPVPDD